MLDIGCAHGAVCQDIVVALQDRGACGSARKHKYRKVRSRIS